MKHNLFYGFISAALLFSASVQAETVTFYTNVPGKVQSAVLPTPLTKLSSTKYINLETPFRCSVKDFGAKEIATTIALKNNDFQMVFFDKIDDLPRYEVNGYSFYRKPVDEAIQNLVEEANITVYTEDGAYPSLDATDVYGELTDVINELTNAGNIFYRYDAEKKELYLSRKGRFELQLPENRMVMLAILDALRGAGITEARPDWKKNTILMTLSHEEKEQVQYLMKHIVNDSYLLLADTHVYRLTPRSVNADWQNIILNYGPDRVYSASNGLIGKILDMGHHTQEERLFAYLGGEFNVSPMGQGVAIVPNGWKMRFDVGQCTPNTEIGPLSILFSTKIKTPDQVETNVTLDTRTGEISTFNVVSALDNELAILGVPTLNGVNNNELLVTLKLRLIRLTKGN